jgi:hypothetical protein
MGDIRFEVVDPDAAVGEYLSATKPGIYVSIERPEGDIRWLNGAQDVVIEEATIDVLYNYPLGTVGPSEQEARLNGWIFSERAPNSGSFTRADLVRVIAARYRQIYDAENAEDAPVAGPDAPHPFNRCYTNGRYGIWGHDIGDLLLYGVRQISGTNVYQLGIDS